MSRAQRLLEDKDTAKSEWDKCKEAWKHLGEKEQAQYVPKKGRRAREAEESDVPEPKGKRETKATSSKSMKKRKDEIKSAIRSAGACACNLN